MRLAVGERRLLELRTSHRRVKRENDAKVRELAKERADAKAEKERAKAEALAKAAKKKPVLDYLCNYLGCSFKSPKKGVVTDHCDKECFHGKKKKGPFCKVCGNQGPLMCNFGVQISSVSSHKFN